MKKINIFIIVAILFMFMSIGGGIAVLHSQQAITVWMILPIFLGVFSIKYWILSYMEYRRMKKLNEQIDE